MQANINQINQKVVGALAQVLGMFIASKHAAAGTVLEGGVNSARARTAHKLNGLVRELAR